jgi:hypothetical protein
MPLKRFTLGNKTNSTEFFNTYQERCSCQRNFAQLQPPTEGMQLEAEQFLPVIPHSFGIFILIPLVWHFNLPCLSSHGKDEGIHF